MAEKDGDRPSKGVHMLVTLGHYHSADNWAQRIKSLFKKPRMYNDGTEIPQFMQLLSENP